MTHPDIDYESLASAYLALLDRIDCHPDETDEIHAICSQRFEIAEQHGLTVVFDGTPVSGEMQ